MLTNTYPHTLMLRTLTSKSSPTFTNNNKITIVIKVCQSINLSKADILLKME